MKKNWREKILGRREEAKALPNDLIDDTKAALDKIINELIGHNFKDLIKLEAEQSPNLLAIAKLESVMQRYAKGCLDIEIYKPNMLKQALETARQSLQKQIAIYDPEGAANYMAILDRNIKSTLEPIRQEKSRRSGKLAA